MKSIRASIAAALAAGLLFVGGAAADTPNTGGDNTNNQPLTPTDSKTFGDWTVRCYAVASPSPCDMYELLANKQNNQRVMSMSIAYLPATDKHVIQIAVPLGVSIPKGLIIESDTYTSPLLQYRRCDRGGCYVEMLFDNAAITALASVTGQAKVKIVADGGKVFDIPFSLNGYGDAHGAMVDLARKKVAGGTTTPPAHTPPPATTTTPDTTTTTTPPPATTP